MKYTVIFSALCLTVLNSTVFSGTRVSEIGSHPYLSWKVYPQDIMQWGGSFLYYHPNYMKSPYWGDIDDPDNKPASTYITTGTEVADGQANFEHSAAKHTVGNRFGYAHQFSNVMSNFELDYGIDALRTQAGGNMTHSEEDSAGNSYQVGYIPFDYSNDHMLNNFSFQGAAGFQMSGFATGLRAKVSYENTLSLDQQLEFEKNSVPYTSKRAVWGWSTSGCNHIFGPRGTEGDAWLQNEYAQGPMYTVELQGGMTLPKLKFGSLVRYKFGWQDQYSWQSDPGAASGDPVIDANFMGSYVKDNLTRKNHDALVHLYGNLNLRQSERFALNALGLVGYQGGSTRDALASNRSIEDDDREKMRTVVVEAGPNINVRLGENFNYIDAAVLVEYSYTRLDNTIEYNVGGGSESTHRNSSVVRTDDVFEVFWENFSYANQGHVDFGADLSTMFPVFSSPVGTLGLGLILYAHTRYTRQTKFYGTNSDDGNNVTFTVDDKRINTVREVFFNSALMLQYMAGPYHLRFEITEPVLQSQVVRSRIKDTPDDRTVRPPWSSPNGLQVGLYLSYAMTMPFLR